MTATAGSIAPSTTYARTREGALRVQKKNMIVMVSDSRFGRFKKVPILYNYFTKTHFLPIQVPDQKYASKRLIISLSKPGLPRYCYLLIIN